MSQNGVAVTNAWRLSSKQSNTSCIFQAKSSEQRDKWIGYFLQERKIVYETTSGNELLFSEDFYMSCISRIRAIQDCALDKYSKTKNATTSVISQKRKLLPNFVQELL